MRYRKVTYYSLLRDGEDYLEFDKFRRHHRNHPDHEVKQNYQDILALIDLMGKTTGCRDKFFKHEGAAHRLLTLALPQSGAYAEMLRLFCIRIGADVCVLLNGAVKNKRARTAQECPNVAPHFLFANEVATALDRHIIDKEVKFHSYPLPIEFEIRSQ
ncbi:MAG: hypothetical protein ACOCZ8_00525 [Bacteroidota bacterium]